MLPFIRNTAYKKRAFILGLVAILMAAAPLGAHNLLGIWPTSVLETYYFPMLFVLC